MSIFLSGRAQPWLTFFSGYQLVQRIHPLTVNHHNSFACLGESTMENNREHLESHEEREAQTLVERIEKKEASQEAAREAETKRTLDEYGKTVGI
jgi:hypothetical protein